MIKLDNQGPIAIVTINRAERRNALGSQLMRDLNAALADSERNDAISAVVLTGAPPAFCAGSDLKELAGLSIADMCKHEAETATFARAIGYRAKPVIAAVEGYALGGGMILAASCDIVVAASNARWHLPEAPNGWLPPWGLTALLTARCGRAVSRGARLRSTRSRRRGSAWSMTSPSRAPRFLWQRRLPSDFPKCRPKPSRRRSASSTASSWRTPSAWTKSRPGSSRRTAKRQGPKKPLNALR